MVEWLELVQIGLVAWASGFFGSLLMWFVIGPPVIKRAAPKVVRGVLQESFSLTDEDLKEAKGDIFKAVTRKQGESFAQAINGALGNLLQERPTDELESLAKKYGFEGVDDAKEKLLGSNGEGIAGLAQRVPPDALARGLEALRANGAGGHNRFTGLVDTIALVQGLGSLMGSGSGGEGMQVMQDVGRGGGGALVRPGYVRGTIQR